MKPKIKNLPKAIYLQVQDEFSNDFNEFYTTWCVDKINKGDIKYVLPKKRKKIKRTTKP